MAEANTRHADIARRWHGLDVAVPALARARDELQETGYEDAAETVAGVHSEMACERDTAEKLLMAALAEVDGCGTWNGSSTYDPETQHEDFNEVVEADRDAKEKFGPAHPHHEDDECEEKGGENRT